MLYDMHTHAFHPKIAPKVLQQLEGYYGIHPQGTGELDELLQQARLLGLDRVVVHCAATTKDQVAPANKQAIQWQQEHPEVIAFGTIHPDLPNWEEQLAKLRENGIKGLKFHPDFQGFFLDDPRLLPIFEAATPDFIILCHVGDVLPPEKNPSCPFKLARLLDLFPKARIIAAHLGGYLHWDYVPQTLVGRNVWLDTSSALPFMTQKQIAAILYKHAPEKILFGSDYPLAMPSAAAKALLDAFDGSEKRLLECMHNPHALFG